MRKISLTLLAVVVLAMGAVESDINPWEIVTGNGRFGPVIRLDSAEVVTEDLTAGAALVEVNTPVDGNATLFGAHVRVLDDVSGSLLAAGAVVEITGTVGEQTDAAGATVYLDGTFTDSLEAGGAVVFVRGSVMGPVFISAAEIYVEETAVIADTLRYTAGVLHVAEGAQLVSGTREIIPEPKEKPTPQERSKRRIGWRLFRVIFSLLFVAGSGIFASLVFRRHFEDVTGRILVNPGFSVLTGFIAAVGFAFVFLLLLIVGALIVGIGAGLVIGGIYLVGFIFSTLYAGTAMGRFILSKLNKGSEPHIILSMLLGVFITVILTHIPYVGFIFWLAAYFFGFGGFLISLWLAIKEQTVK